MRELDTTFGPSSIRTHDRAPLKRTTYPDDIALTALSRRSNFMFTNCTLAAAEVSFAASMHLLGLLVSSKGLALPCDLSPAKPLAFIFYKHAKLHVKPDTKGHDLGLLHNSTTQRRPNLHSKCFEKSRNRLHSISKLTKSVKSARSVINTGN